MQTKLKRPLTRRLDQEFGTSAARDLVSLMLLLGGSGALALVLWVLNGPPHVPQLAGDWERTLLFLNSSSMLSQHALDIVTAIGWLALAYLAFTIALRLSLRALALGGDASWIQFPLKVSDLITLPAIRHIIDSALAAMLVLAISLRAGTPTVLEAAPAMESRIVSEISSHFQGLAGVQSEPCDLPDQRVIQETGFKCFVYYQVRPGDSLWDIARRFYGDGTLYIVIFDVNQGRFMSSGDRFMNPRSISPGWKLDIPIPTAPTANLWQGDNAVQYRVKGDDSLWRIAESFLGDGWRWTEIWEMNKEHDMGGGRRFNNPGQVLPGWVLALPLETHPTSSSSEIASESQAATSFVDPPVVSPSLKLPEADGANEPVAAIVEETGQTSDVDTPILALAQAMAVVTGLAAAGGAALLVRRVRRRASGFFEESTTETNGRPFSGDLGRVVLASEAVLRTLVELEFLDLRVMLVREAQRYLEFTLECTPGDADAVVEKRFDVGRRLACAVDGQVLNSTRVSFKLSRFHRLAGMLTNSESASDRLLLVPLGATDRSIYYLNLQAAGNVLLAGEPRDSARFLSSWVAALASVHGPHDLAFLADGTAAAQLGELSALPHSEPSDPQKSGSVSEVVSELEEMLVARSSHAPVATLSPLVAMVGLDDPELERERLEVVLHRGTEYRMHLIGLSECSDMTELQTGFDVTVALGMFGAGEESDGAIPAADRLVAQFGQDSPLGLEPVEVSTSGLRAVARERGYFETPRQPRADEETFTYNEEDEEEPDIPGGCASAESDLNQRLEEPVEAAISMSNGEQQEEAERQEGNKPTPIMNADSSSRQGVLLMAPDETEEQSAAQDHLFEVRCFGEFQVEAKGKVLTSWSLQKARELLAYLIARGSTAVLREEVAEALWPEGDPDQVGSLLSNAAYHLRRSLKQASGDGAIQALSASGQRYYLRSGLFRVDVDAFDAHVRRAGSLADAEAMVEYERALAEYRGEFLGNEPYEWAEPYRREYQRRFQDAAHKGANVALTSGGPRKAIEFYRAILNCDPIDEEAARGLMQCYEKLGDTNGVRKVYKVLTESLRRELDDEMAEPLPETKAMFQGLINASRSARQVMPG